MQHGNSSNTWRQRSAFRVFVLLTLAVLLVLWMIATFGETKRSVRSAALWHIKAADVGDLPPTRSAVNSSNGHLRQAVTQSTFAADSAQHRRKVNNVYVLGKLAERVVPVADPNIYVSIKTTKKNYKSRVAYLLLTWLQTVEPEKVRQ